MASLSKRRETTRTDCLSQQSLASCLLALLLLLCFTPGTAWSQGKTAGRGGKSVPSQAARYGLARLAERGALPLLRNGQAGSVSYVGLPDGTGRVQVAELRGPGCLYALQAERPEGRLRLFFDGETTPRLDCVLADLFTGKVTPFAAPLVGKQGMSGYCRFPIAFAKSCRIELVAPRMTRFLVQYERLPATTGVRTFTRDLSPDDQEALQAVTEMWGERLLAPAQDAYREQTIRGERTVAPGATLRLATLPSPGEIRTLQCKIGPIDRFTLRQTVLRFYWDGETQPAIEAPIGDLCGTPFGEQRFQDLLIGAVEEGFTLHWPMPFRRSARLELVNFSKRSLQSVSWMLTYVRQAQPDPRRGYLHAQWQRRMLRGQEAFIPLTLAGRGHLVGIQFALQEGDGFRSMGRELTITTDGQTPPVFQRPLAEFLGTVTFHKPFLLPLQGAPTWRYDTWRMAAYRHLWGDSIPFQKSLQLEIGGLPDEGTTDCAALVWWYQDTPTHRGPSLSQALLTPSIYAKPRVREAEQLPWSGGKATEVTDTNLTLEMSGGKGMALSGEKPSFTLEVTEEDVYTIHLGCITTRESPRSVRWSVDEDENLIVFTVGQPNFTGSSRMDAFAPMRLTPGKHTFQMTADPTKPLLLDYVELLPSRREMGVMEAETLWNQVKISGKGRVEREDGNEGSGGSVLVWTPQQPEATLILPIAVPEAGDYTLELGLLDVPNSPRFAVQLGENLLESAEVVGAVRGRYYPKRVRLGRVKGLKAGTQSLILVCKNPPDMKTPSQLHLDFIHLVK